jgi:hypothetical protein
MPSRRPAKAPELPQQSDIRVIDERHDEYGESADRVTHRMRRVTHDGLRGPESTIAVHDLSVWVDVYPATNEWFDNFDWAVSRGL